MAVAGLAPAPAGAGELLSLGLEATVGARHLGLGEGGTRSDPLAAGDLGATALLSIGPLAVGLAAEGAFDRGSLQRVDAGALAGIVLGLVPPVLRLELLGEAGVANLRGTDLADGSEPARYYGLRPGLSLRVPSLPFRVGAWGLVRWGMPGAGGGPAYGLLGRVGLEF